MRVGLMLSVFSFAAVSASSAAAQDVEPASAPPWLRPFDGETLEGWHRVGGEMRYEVEDGVIVGTAVPGQPNGFLRTDRTFADFELELEFQVDRNLNSGVQIRSHVRPNGRRVYGYQVEIDPSERAWTGGIYDEARRGWLDDLRDDEVARGAFRQDQWNHFRVRCVGDSIRTWVNGVAAGDLVDSADLEGFIALQVHGIGRAQPGQGQQPDRQVRWRRIRIRELGAHAWRPLWNGEDLTGWRALPGGSWRVEDGVLVGTSPQTEQRHGILLSEQRYDDFCARIVYRAVRGNSGLYFRCEPVEGGVGVHGFQAEIDPDPEKHSGGLYETGGRAWVVQPKAQDVGFRAAEWNTMTVSARGGRIVVHVNGKKSAELRDDPGRREGHFGVQLHGGQDMRVEVRSIELLRVHERAAK